MTRLGASFKAELSDAVTRPLPWIGVAAAGAAAWVAGHVTPIQSNGYVIFKAALEAGARAASFFLIGIAAISVAGERSRGTVRWILPRPISRAGFVLGKACALAIVTLGFLVMIVGVSWGVALPYGFGDVVLDAADDGFEYEGEQVVDDDFQAATMRRRTAATALLVLPALLTATGIGFLVSSLLRSAAAAVILSITVALPLTYIHVVLGLSNEGGRVLPFRAASEFLDQLGEFGRGLATADWPAYGTGPLLGAVVAVIGLPVLAALVFRRLDITD